jgi:uncharacterized membrane protein YidH (DUF202 family)
VTIGYALRMNNTAGTGLLGLGVVLAALGAILDYAVSVHTTGFNINEIGLIILIVGIVSFLVGLAVLAFGSRNRTIVREDVRNVPGGQTRITERDERLP